MRNYRVVDLSWQLTPPNPDVGGFGPRRLDIRRKTIWLGEYSFDVDITSHSGTHVEAPSHYIPAVFPERVARDISVLPIELFLGPAYVVDLQDLEPRAAILPEHLAATGAGRGDILLIGNSRHAARGQKPYLSREAARWMVDHGIKMAGMDNTLAYEEPGVQTMQEMHTHLELLSHDIPFLENMAHMDQLHERHVFFIALPLNIVGLDSCPVRAVALEGVY